MSIYFEQPSYIRQYVFWALAIDGIVGAIQQPGFRQRRGLLQGCLRATSEFTVRRQGFRGMQGYEFEDSPAFGYQF